VIRETLVAVYGPKAGLGDTTLWRVLREAGLWMVGRSGGAREQVTELHGGGGLVLLLAAELETGAVRSLGGSVLSLASEHEGGGGMARLEVEKRDDRGRFTTASNDTRHERYTASQVDPIYHSVDEVRGERDLSRLQVSSMRAETLANRRPCPMRSTSEIQRLTPSRPA